MLKLNVPDTIELLEERIARLEQLLQEHHTYEGKPMIRMGDWPNFNSKNVAEVLKENND